MQKAIDRYVVVGNPIEHSRSPEIHQAFAAQFGDAIEYGRMLVKPGEFAAYANEFAASGGRGMNVTVPFKVDAFRYVDTRDALAEGAGAVNTIVFSDVGSQGFNTDGVGLMNDLVLRHKVELANKTVVLLGAGGAALGVVNPLLDARPTKLIVANRTLANAQALVARQRARRGNDAPLSALTLDGLETPPDVIINATSSGLSGSGALIDAGLGHGAFCYDMSYGDAAEFYRWAAANGAHRSVDGLGMLVEQAAEAYYQWRGKRPATQPVVDQLREGLG